MKKNASANAATAPALHPSAGQLFSELGHSATFFDSIPNEVVIIDDIGNIRASNDQFKNAFGEAHPKNLFEMIETSPSEILKSLERSVLGPKTGLKIQYKTISLTPRLYDVDVYRLSEAQPLYGLIHHQNEFSGFGAWKDQLKSSEKSHARKELSLLDDAKIGVLRLDASDSIISANPKAVLMLGKSISGMKLSDFRLNSISTTPRIVQAVTTDGTTAKLTAFRMKISETENIAVLDDSALTEQSLEKYERGHEFYRVFAEESEYEIARFEMRRPVSIENDTNSIIESVLKETVLTDHSLPHNEPSEGIEPNTSLLDFIGNEVEAREIAKMFVDSDFRILRQEFTETTTSGELYHFYTNVIGTVEDETLLRFWLTRRDITLRRQAEKAYAVAEDQLRQSQKVEPIGRLAGGIAHDFNNFLAVIMLQIEMIKQELTEDDPLHERIGEIVTVSNKAANTVKQLLAFGRKQTMRPQNVQLNEGIRDFIKMIRPLIGEDIEMDVVLDEDLGVCFIDPNQLTQILMNLAVNAKDAMPDGGVLTIRTRNLTIDENTFKHRAQPKGRYVEIEVSDNGCGMTQRTAKHAFEPFFTTKEAHKGTGLGLATVYGIVKQSKGFIWVNSELEKGTSFKVHFPRTDREKKSVRLFRQKKIPRGNETILLVEDEDLIRKTSSEVLTALGYNVLVAGDGIEALEVAEKHYGKIDLLLSDVVMPRMNGRDLGNHLRKEFPGLAIVFVSGYADDIITRHGILEDDVHFLGKPFSPLSLAERVREALKNVGEKE